MIYSTLLRCTLYLLTKILFQILPKIQSIRIYTAIKKLFQDMHQYLLGLPKPLHPHHPHQPISCNQTWIKGHQHRIRERPHLQGWRQEQHSHRRVPRNQMQQLSNSTHRNLPQTDRRRDIVRQKIINFVFMYYSCKWHLNSVQQKNCFCWFRNVMQCL